MGVGEPRQRSEAVNEQDVIPRKAREVRVGGDLVEVGLREDRVRRKRGVGPPKAQARSMNSRMVFTETLATGRCLIGRIPA